MPNINNLADLHQGLDDVSYGQLNSDQLRHIGISASAQVIKANPGLDPDSENDRLLLKEQLINLLRTIGLIPDPETVRVDAITKLRTYPAGRDR